MDVIGPKFVSSDVRHQHSVHAALIIYPSISVESALLIVCFLKKSLQYIFRSCRGDSHSIVYFHHRRGGFVMCDALENSFAIFCARVHSVNIV